MHFVAAPKAQNRLHLASAGGHACSHARCRAPPRKREREEASNERPPETERLRPQAGADVGETIHRGRVRDADPVARFGPPGRRARADLSRRRPLLIGKHLDRRRRGNLAPRVEPLLRAGNHVRAGTSPAHRAFGPGNRGGLPCKMNRRAQAAWRGTEFEDTHELVPITGPSPARGGAAADPGRAAAGPRAPGQGPPGAGRAGQGPGPADARPACSTSRAARSGRTPTTPGAGRRFASSACARTRR